MNGTTSFISLTGKELRTLARDPQGLALLFGMPALLVFVLSLALKDIYDDKVGRQLPVVLEVSDEGDAALAVAESLRRERNLVLVGRPAGESNRDIFRSGAARAVITIPHGFSDAARVFVSSGGSGDLGDSRIRWEISPSLDGAYKTFLEARLAITCLEFVRGELVRGTSELADQLVETSSAVADLERVAGMMGGLLEDTLQQLESLSSLLGSDRDQLVEAAKADALELVARREAEAARARLSRPAGGAQGIVRSDSHSSSTPPVRREVIDYSNNSSRTRPRNPAFDELDQLRATRAEAESRRAEPRRNAPGEFAERKLEVDVDVFLRQSQGEQSSLPSPLQQTVPGWSLFAMFFVVVPLSQGLHRERTEGTLLRMRSLAVPNTAIVLGKLVPYVLIGALQFAGMLVVGMLLVPAVSELKLTLGREPWVLVPITLVAATAASSYGLLVASLAKTPEQAAAFGPTSVVILSVISGIMVPHFLMPAVLQKVALISPLYWGHQAYLDAFLHDAGLMEVAPALGVLLVFAFSCVLLASRRVVRT